MWIMLARCVIAWCQASGNNPGHSVFDISGMKGFNFIDLDEIENADMINKN